MFDTFDNVWHFWQFWKLLTIFDNLVHFYKFDKFEIFWQFSAVQNSSIGLIVRPSVCLLSLTIRVFTTQQSEPRDLWPLRYLIKGMKRHYYLPANLPTYPPTYLATYIHIWAPTWYVPLKERCVSRSVLTRDNETWNVLSWKLHKFIYIILTNIEK